MKKIISQTLVIISVVTILFLIAVFLYQTFFRPNYTGGGNIITIILFGIIIGIVITSLVYKIIKTKQSGSLKSTSSHTVVESIKRVFKIVVAEGQMNEIFNYENTKKLLKFIPSTKKALVIVRAKTLVGYDINKCKWEINEEDKVIKLLDFPKPEILSLETDFNYYYFEDDLFNFISRNDLQEIQHLAKDQVKRSVLQSDLLKIAADQMKLLIGEVVSVNNWNVENTELIDDYAYPPEVEEKKTEQIEPSILNKVNLLDKAINLFKLKPGNTNPS